MEPELDSFKKLIEIVADLRDPQSGCPWDLEQTHSSLGKYLKEETDEVLEVLETFDGDNKHSDYEALCEELGDVLLQVMLHAQLAREDSKFTIDDVITGLNEKLIRRHPHVFGDSDAKSIEEVAQQWERIKKEEKESKI